MENPATWGKAEHVVHEALRVADAVRMDFVCGLSVERQITDALRAAGLLREDSVLLPIDIVEALIKVPVCGVCMGISPSWDGHDANPPCIGYAREKAREALDALGQ